MYLKQLELQGFKSFADKIVINFEEGITAIVGPNGCGKSNIVDAIRWVLCETNPRKIRGIKGSDVIFHGSATRPAVGFAQVSLLLDNSSNWLNLNSAEVLITRKLYADGESGYFINREPVRMKDIKELFMNTGVMTNSYTTIELAEVNAILESSPQQIRIFFDEAAGVTKFRVHREETIRRIERTQADLNRIEDVKRELEGEIKVLESQARKAKRYEKLKQDLNQAILNNLLCDWLEYQKKDEVFRKSLERLNTSLTEAQTSYTLKASELEKMKMEMDACEEAISTTQKKNTEIYSQKKVLEEKTSFIKNRLSTLPQEIENLQQKLKENEEIYIHKKQKLEELLSQKDEIEKSFAQVRDLSEIESSKLLEKLEGAKKKLFSTVSEIATLKNRILSLDEMRSRINFQIQKNLKQKEEEKKEKKEIQNQVNEIQKSISEAKTTLENLQNSKKDLFERISSIKEEIENSKNKFQKLRIEVGKLEKEREIFEKSKSRWKEFVLQMSKEEGFICDLESEVEFISEEGKALSSFLRQFGGVLFFKNTSSVEKLKEKENIPPVLIVCAESLDKLQTSQEDSLHFRTQNSLVKKFLNFIFSIKDERNQFFIKKDRTIKLPFGIYISQIFKGGSKDISKEIEEVLSRIKQTEDEIKNKKSALQDEERKLQGLIDEISEKERLIFEKESYIKQLKNELQNLNSRVDILEKEKEDFEKNIKKIEEEKQEISKKISELEVKRNEYVNELALLEKTQATQEEARKLLTDAEIEARKQRFEKFQVEWKQVQDDIKRIEEENAKMEGDLRAFEDEYNLLKKRKEEIETELSSIAEELEKIQSEESTHREKLARMREVLKELESETSGLNAQVFNIKKEISIAENERRHISEILEGLSRRIFEEYNLKVADALKEIPNPIRTPDEEVGKLKARVEALGTVNLLAPEDYQRLTERHEFMRKHSDDLKKAIEDMQKIINEANRQIRKNFLETFEKAQENFKNVFATFFEGGKAEIRLTNPDNLIETGVEVHAAPPGKRINSNTQLSSGERALTAIALLFSLFQIKPSPFCILDEVDAPLDEANVVRFNKLLREFSKNTQFVVITHNKRTMEMADVMYGITMEEFGVSKLISVDYRKVLE